MIKNILVAIGEMPHEKNAFHYAGHLAVMLDAHLSCVFFQDEKNEVPEDIAARVFDDTQAALDEYDFLDAHIDTLIGTPGLSLHGSDGKIGSVDDILIDADAWVLRYMTVERRGYLRTNRIRSGNGKGSIRLSRNNRLFSGGQTPTPCPMGQLHGRRPQSGLESVDCRRQLIPHPSRPDSGERRDSDRRFRY